MSIFRRFKEKAARRRAVSEAIRNGKLAQFHQENHGTYMMDATWDRSEELRVDRLGPSQDDIENPERVRVERWRPSRSLGPL